MITNIILNDEDGSIVALIVTHFCDLSFLLCVLSFLALWQVDLDR